MSFPNSLEDLFFFFFLLITGTFCFCEIVAALVFLVLEHLSNCRAEYNFIWKWVEKSHKPYLLSLLTKHL